MKLRMKKGLLKSILALALVLMIACPSAADFSWAASQQAPSNLFVSEEDEATDEIAEDVTENADDEETADPSEESEEASDEGDITAEATEEESNALNAEDKDSMPVMELMLAGSKTFTTAGIVERMGIATYFMVLSNSLEMHDETEGNIAVTTLDSNKGTQLGVSENNKTYLKIKINKTVSPSVDKDTTFDFVIVEKDTKKETKTSVTVKAGNTTGSTTVDMGETKKSYEVFEVYNGKKLSDGDKYGDYTVTYESSEGLSSEIINYDSTSFAKNIKDSDGTIMAKTAGSTLVTTDKNIKFQNGEVKVVSDSEFDSLVNIPGTLSKLTSLSKDLAEGKDGNDVVFYTMDPKNLPYEGGNIVIPAQVGSSKTLVINVVCEGNSVDILPGNEVFVGANGQHNLWTHGGYSTQSSAEMANRTIWNFVDKNGNPFTGTIKHTKEIGGTFLAPQATIYGGQHCPASFYGKNVIQTGGEMHEGGFPDVHSREGIVAVKNTKPEVKPDPVTVDFEALKTLQGKALEKGEFTFTMKDDKGNVLDQTTNKDGGKVTFKSITYDKAGEYNYTIVEEDKGQKGDGSLITYDTSVFNVNVKVEKKNNELVVSKTITKEGKAVSAMEFKNTYEEPVDPQGSVDFMVMKTLKGKTLKGNDFAFELKDEKNQVIETVKNDKDGLAVFETINYTKADIGKTYNYTIQEVIPEDKAEFMTYDQSVYTAEVKISQEGRSQKLTVDYKYYKDGKEYTEPTFNFVNEYKPEAAIQLEAIKTMVGRDLRDKEFTFTLKDAAGTIVDQAKNDDGGLIKFKPMYYTTEDVGEYKYTVTEEVGQPIVGGKIIYDASVYDVTIKVQYEDDQLTVAKEIAKRETPAAPAVACDKIEFKNTYKPPINPRSLSAYIDLEGTKTMEGKPLEAGEFEFIAVDTETGAVTLPGQNEEDGSFFVELSYNAGYSSHLGEHHYEIKEVNNGEENVKYDDTVYHVTTFVEVKEDEEGNPYLDAQITDSDIPKDGMKFVNKFEPETSISIEAEKTLEGKDLEDKEFTFTLEDESGKVLQEVKNDDGGKVVFDDINYTLSDLGEHNYKVTEVEGSQPQKGQMHYDESVYEVKVNVAVEGNKLVATKTITKDGQAVDSIQFVNVYEPPVDPQSLGTSIDFEGVKTLEGRKLKDGEFNFTATDVKTGQVYKASNDADGNFVITIEYDEKEVGIHEYKFQEVVGKDKNIKYDTRVYTAKVKVTKDVKSMAAEVISSNIPAGGLKFVNTFDPPTPKTGDNMPLFPFIGLMLASLIGAAAAIFGKKKHA